MTKQILLLYTLHSFCVENDQFHTYQITVHWTLIYISYMIQKAIVCIRLISVTNPSLVKKNRKRILSSALSVWLCQMFSSPVAAHRVSPGGPPCAFQHTLSYLFVQHTVLFGFLSSSLPLPCQSLSGTLVIRPEHPSTMMENVEEAWKRRRRCLANWLVSSPLTCRHYWMKAEWGGGNDLMLSFAFRLHVELWRNCPTKAKV